MALYPCPECKREISTDAKACPHCGKKAGWEATQARFDALPKGMKIFLACAIAFFVLAMMVSGASDKGAPLPKAESATAAQAQKPTVEAAKPAPAADGTMTVQPGTWFGFRNREHMEKATQFAVQGDKDAFAKFMMNAMAAKAAIAFKAGEKVYLDDTAMFAGLVKVRRKGETEGWWTNFEAVK